MIERAAAERGKVDRLPGLENRLFDIPEEKFIEVVRLLERVRDHPDVRQTFAAIRPRLVQVRPGRRPTLKRVLCMPFEDVLESFGGVDVPLGRIERRVIDPVWRLVTECGDTALIDQLDRQVQETAPGNLNALRNIGRRLWPMAAQAIRAAVEQGAGRQALWRVLNGDEEMKRQVLDVAAFLEMGLTVESLKDALAPKPLTVLEDRHVVAIEQAAQAVARQSTGLVYYLLLVAASRMASPADLLTVLSDLDFGKARREQPVIFAQLSGLVVTNLEERSARLDGNGYSAGPDRAAVAMAPEEAIAIAERLVASVNTTSAVMDFLADPVYRERLDAVKAAVRTMVAGTVLDTAPAGILTAVPAPAEDGRPAPVDENAQEAAEDHARALRRCEGLAEALGLHEPLKDAMASMEKGLLVRAHALLAQYPNAAGDPEDAETAEITLFYALRLLELVAGPAKADQLRAAIMAATGEFAEGEEE
ncbi:hypothetical protein TSH100_26450 [Azospirillum sp. TSH100]|uniref:hypothetical protein n=1 Tax=Azospirillum sp. TSH100 TaxID=652764 RepID=UPI000D622140|nr:hypothetical protein [Azospirillum sp. TSH100]PWC81729.1 hypothetical protein TSH100_26450 [Azospirillum sp. TSH100]QCG88995.1 hypothetical protein E6C72_14315 [Azospirillum sp. TSH100]